MAISVKPSTAPAIIPATDSTLHPPSEIERSGFKRTFGATIDFPNFRALWSASLAAALGQWMQTTAIGWLAFDLTDSKSFVGLVAFVAGLPYLLVSLPGGVLLDRFDRRKVLMICQALASILACLVAVDVIGGWVEPWHLPILGFFNGSLQAVLSPSQQSLVPKLVPRDALTNAVGLMSAGSNMTRVVGPSLAGAIIGFSGTGEAFLVQAVALLVALYCSTRIALAGEVRAATSSGLKGVLDGMRLIWGKDDLRGLFLLASIPSFFVFPYISFMAVYAKDVLGIGPAGLGLLMATSGSGAVIGGLMVAAARDTRNIGRKLIMRTLFYCVTIGIFSQSGAIWLSLPVLVGAGLLGANFMSGINVMIQHGVTDEYRGRVMGTYMLTWGLMPLGALPLGVAADQIGIQHATLCGVAVCIVLTLLLTRRNRTLLRI